MYTPPENVWNRLVKLRNSSTDPEIKKIANLYLSQLNTAAGSIYVTNSAENWIDDVTLHTKK